MFNLKTALRGYPWSIYILQNNRGLIAFAHTDRPIAAIGYIGSMFAESGYPAIPYSIGMNHNPMHTFFPLDANCFDAEGLPNSELLHAVLKLDPKAPKRRTLTNGPFFPDFRAASTRRTIPTKAITDKIYSSQG